VGQESETVTSFSHNYLERLKGGLAAFPHDEFESMIRLLIDALHKGKHIFVMGNGGSGSIASHWACDLNKECSTRNNRFKVICLNDNIPIILAYANDLNFNNIFVEQLKNFLTPGDILIGISGSGNSENILKAIEYANNHGGITIGLCGFADGALPNKVDLSIVINADNMQNVEDICMILAHMSMQRIQSELCFV
jgi:D-sedoheptulose 7-phosphate isomerase